MADNAGPVVDEFDIYDFLELTEDDFATIDTFTAQALHSSTAGSVPAEPTTSTVISAGEPAVRVEVETHSNALPKNIQPRPLRRYESSESRKSGSFNQSPYGTFRAWRRWLSVTDIASPSWCEVQYDYSLRQQRNKKIEDRPAIFKSSSGKSISVSKDVAVRNDRRLKRGQSVHKMLEQEVRPKEIVVKTTVAEERWALRLYDMLSCFMDLLGTRGCAREMPVFGVLHGQLIHGVIDEVLRKSTERRSSDQADSPKRRTDSTHQTPKAKKTRREPSQDESQADLTSFFPVSPFEETTATAESGNGHQGLANNTTPTKPPPPTKFIADSTPPKYTLHLMDWKTRRSSSSPPAHDTIGSRMQLMTYHRLLSELISTEVVFDWARIWSLLGVNASKLFSPAFQQQLGATSLASIDESGTHALCLNDLTAMLHRLIPTLNLEGVHHNLTLVYRTRPGKLRKSNSVTKQTSSALIRSILSQDEIEISKAVEESLKHASGASSSTQVMYQASSIIHSAKQSAPTGEVDMGLLTHPQDSTQDIARELIENPQMAWTIQEGLLKHAQSTGRPVGEETETEDSSSETEQAEAPPGPEPSTASEIIGQSEFKYNAKWLDSHVRSILKWWHGERKPLGVSVQNSNRCFSCEYRTGCEWRDQKTKEAAEKLKERQAART